MIASRSAAGGVGSGAASSVQPVTSKPYRSCRCRPVGHWGSYPHVGWHVVTSRAYRRETAPDMGDGVTAQRDDRGNGRGQGQGRGSAGGEYRRGPVTLRGSQVPETTADRRLLDERGPASWLHQDPWRVLRIQSEFVEGFGALAELGPAISVFGSARLSRESAEYAMAVELGRRLAQVGYAVITGGGPGAMEGANKGAVEGGGVSVG